MKWWGYLICGILIIAGFFCGMNMFNVWSRTSSVEGSPTTIETENDYSIVAKFDCGTLALETDDNSNYSGVLSFGAVDFDGTEKEYILLINDNLISDVTFYPGRVDVNYTMNFYNTSGELASTLDLNIDIEFYDSNTALTFKMTNEDSSYAYLTQYLNYNGLIIKICERGGEVWAKEQKL